MTNIVANLTPAQRKKFADEGIDLNTLVTPEMAALLPTDAPLTDNLPAPFRFTTGRGARGKALDARRNAVMATFEQQYPGKFITFEAKWDTDDMHVTHDGVIYYHKPSIQEKLIEEQQEYEQDPTERPIPYNAFVEVIAAWGADILGPLSLTDIEAIIAASPAGMPTYIASNSEFYEFEAVSGSVVTPNTMTRETLDLIRNTLFTDPFGLYYAPADNALVVNDDQLYMTNLLMWYKRPTIPALGVYFHGGNLANCFFFPFEPLTSSQRDAVVKYCAYEHSKSKALKIVDL
jgi:hypothetical protein